MNNSIIKHSNRAIRRCALPLAVLIAVSASAASNSWTEATDEVWKSDAHWALPLNGEKAEHFNAIPTAATSAEFTAPVLKVVTPEGLITIGNLTLNIGTANPDKQTDEEAVRAILACSGNQASPAVASLQWSAGNATGENEVNLSRIAAVTLTPNEAGVRVNAEAQEAGGRSLTGRLSGSSRAEFALTTFSGRGARSPRNPGIVSFSNSNPGSNSGAGSRAVATRTARITAAASFLSDGTEKPEANTAMARNFHDNLLPDYGRNLSPETDPVNIAPNYVAEVESAAGGNVTGIASYIAQNNLFKAGQTKPASSADLTGLGLPKQSGDNSNSLTVPTGSSLTSGYQEVPTTQFASTATSFGSLTVLPQSSSPTFAFGTLPITGNNSTSYYAAAAPTLSGATATDSTLSVAQFNSNQKTPTLRRALSIVSAPGDKTSILFGTDLLTLKDNTGAVLSAGTSANGDGMAVQIGYYSTATVGNNFSGTWIPLTGQNSVNSAYLSASIGDEGTAGGIPDGEFYSGDQLELIEGSATRGNFPSSTTIPLSLRFYNAALVSNATRYNTVSDDLWLWKTPGSSSPLATQVIMTLADLGLEWEGGAGSEFKTTLVIPEPTSAFLLALGAVGLLGRRRRRA